MKLKLFIMGLMLLFGSVSADVQLHVLKGDALQSYLPQITEFCHTFYAEYPYLYTGEASDYECYINFTLTQSGEACLAIDENKLVGLATGISLSESRANYRDPFVSKGMDISSLYYIGEFGVLNEYRHQGLEKQLFQKLAAKAKETGTYEALIISEIENWKYDPSQPEGFEPMENFWKSMNFERLPLSFSVLWRNIDDQEETVHTLFFWKHLLN